MLICGGPLLVEMQEMVVCKQSNASKISCMFSPTHCYNMHMFGANECEEDTSCRTCPQATQDRGNGGPPPRPPPRPCTVFSSVTSPCMSSTTRSSDKRREVSRDIDASTRSRCCFSLAISISASSRFCFSSSLSLSASCRLFFSFPSSTSSA